MKARLFPITVCLLLALSALAHLWQRSRLEAFRRSVQLELGRLPQMDSSLSDISLIQREQSRRLTDLEYDLEARRNKVSPPGEHPDPEAEQAIVDLAMQFAGTKDEEFGRERALFHAKKIQAAGGAGFATPEAHVETFFKAARELRRSR